MRTRGLIVSIAAACLVVGCSIAPTPDSSAEHAAKSGKPLSPTVRSRSKDRPILRPEQAAQLVQGDVPVTSATTVNMSDVASLGAQGAVGSPRVVGGAMIDSPFTEEQVKAAREYAKENAPGGNVQTLADGSDNLAVNNNGKGKGEGKKGPKLRAVIDSIGAEDCCVDDVPFSATVPPDPDMAVGPNHMIAVVNVSFEIYDKQGNVLKPATSYGSLFAGVLPFPGFCDQAGPFDPDVVYDEYSGQFVIGVDGGGAFYCIGITTDGDPLGNWNLYAFLTIPPPFTEFFDFPHMGVGPDAIYVGSNQFDPGFVGGAVFAVNKAQMLAGDSIDVIRRDVPRFDGTPQPATYHGAAEGTLPASGPHFIMTEVFDGIIHSVYAWDDPFGADDFYLVGDVDLAAASGVPCPSFSCFPVDVPQAGSNVVLAGNDWRGQETKYRNGKLYTTQTISCNPTGDGAVNCIRWAEIDPDNIEVGTLDPTFGFPVAASSNGVVQAGVFSSADGAHRFFPSIDVNACGDIAVGYSKSSPTMFPSVAITGQRRNDQPGRMRGEVDVIAGTAPYVSFLTTILGISPERWGDYSGMTVDPNGKDFWYIGEYSTPSSNPFANWNNAIAKSDFGCGVNGVK